MSTQPAAPHHHPHLEVCSVEKGANRPKIGSPLGQPVPDQGLRHAETHPRPRLLDFFLLDFPGQQTFLKLAHTSAAHTAAGASFAARGPRCYLLTVRGRTRSRVQHTESRETQMAGFPPLLSPSRLVLPSHFVLSCDVKEMSKRASVVCQLEVTWRKPAEKCCRDNNCSCICSSLNDLEQPQE